jgi:glycosyltransferase involved in cell wall biosynthesis
VKRILFAAPGVSPPLTEGRKLFVNDLAAALRTRGHNVAVLDGAQADSGTRAIAQTLQKLRRYCESDSVDAVFIFPYGTFHGVRAWANTYFIRRSRAICAAAKIAAVPVFYSCAGMELHSVGRRFGPALAVGRQSENLRSIHLGLRSSPCLWTPSNDCLRRLLFLCGYQKPSRASWRNVLLERGLLDLLRAGNALARNGIRLTVAIPFFREPSMQYRLNEAAAELCPDLAVEVRDEVDSAAVFQEHDAFVFPYRAEHAVFISTTLLEALAAGIPTVAADHAMYRSLTLGACGPRCGLHAIGDAKDLASRLLAVQRDYAAAVLRAREEAATICDEWNIERSADELLDALLPLS